MSNEYYLYCHKSRSNFTALKKSRFSFLFFLMVVMIFVASNKIVGQEKLEHPEIESRFELSPEAEVSVITCGPGKNELYASFGHSAFRVPDIANKIDRVYNYGTFDFNTPNFYMKFARANYFTS